MFNKLKEAIALAEAKEFEENALDIMSEDSVFDDELYEFMKQDIIQLEESVEVEEDYSDIEFFTEGEDKEECKDGECEKEEKPAKEEKDDKKEEPEADKEKEEKDEEEKPEKSAKKEDKEEEKPEKDDEKDEDEEELDEGCCSKKAMNNEAFSDIFFDKRYNAKRHLKKSHAAEGEVTRIKSEVKRLKREGASEKVIERAEKDLRKAEKKAYKAGKNAARARIKVLGESSEGKDVKKIPVKEIQKEMDDDVEIEELLESVCEDF